MVLTSSTMLALGSPAPDFKLPDVTTGKLVSLNEVLKEKGLLVMFICQHCPYVQHIKEELTKLGRDYEKKEIGLVAISSNDADNYPDDSPAELKKFFKSQGFSFPLLFDQTQKVAHAYTAACTPDFFLFDKNKKLAYRGRLDESKPSSGIPVTGKELRAALDSLIHGRPLGMDQTPSMGCNIKWKRGNEPPYYG